MACSEKKFLMAVDQIVSEQPEYRKGGSATDGTCDCIGLIIGALKRCGVGWDGIHGSNWAARNAMVSSPAHIVTAGDLKVCDIIYKIRNPGDDKYDLPSRYDSSKDRKDYYHVGVVVSVSPLRIAHVTTPTSKIDTKLGKWSYAGRLKERYVKKGDDPTPEPEPTTLAVVYAPSGGTVKLRKTPSRKETMYWNVPTGNEAEVVTRGDTWSEIRVNDTSGALKRGYMMTEYLRFETENTAYNEADGYLSSTPVEAAKWGENTHLNGDTGTDSGEHMVMVSEEKLWELYKLIESMVSKG